MTGAALRRPRSAWVRWAAWGSGAVGTALILLAIVLRVALPDPAIPAVGGTLGVLDMVGYLGVPVVGALIASRLPGNPYGWVWCGLGLCCGVLFLFQVLRDAGRMPPQLPGYWDRFPFLAMLVLVVLVFLLFPTGRPPSRRWGWMPFGAAALGLATAVVSLFAAPRDDAVAAGPFGQPGPEGEGWAAVTLAGIVSMFVLVLLAMLSVVPRYRHAGSVEREQLKWFLLAALINAATFLVAVLGPFGWTIWNLSLGLLPVAVGIAVLRYRLYEIDRILSRTVSYGLLTVGLLGVYVAVVTLLRGLLDPVTGGSNLAVAGSTLAVAAAFRPARRRVQTAVDRRFDRTRYDAVRTVDDYARRLRRSVDLDDVTAGLRETVAAAVGPERVSVWLRDRPEPPATASRG